MSGTEVRSTAKRRTAALTPKPVYAFTVVAVAVYALGLILCRPPVSGHIAVSTVAVTGSSTTIDSASIRRAISNDNLLRAALRNAGPPAPLPPGADFPSQADLVSTKAGLGVVAGDSPRQLKVTFLGPDAGHATRVADAVTTALIAGAGATGAAPQKGEAELAAARAAEARAQAALNDFLQRKFAGGAATGDRAMLIPTRLPAVDGSSITRTAYFAPQDGSPAEDEEGASAGEDVNPQRTELLRQLNGLIDQRDLAGANVEQLKKIDRQIAIVRDALKSTPRTTDLEFKPPAGDGALQLTPPSGDTTPAPATIQPRPAPATPEAAVTDADAVKLRTLTTKLNNARQTRRQLEAKLADAATTPALQPDLARTPAVIGSTGGKPFSMMTAAIIAAAAMFCGLGVAFITPRRSDLNTLASVEDVEVHTGVRVLGAVTTPGTKPPTRSATGRAMLSQALTATAESTIAVLLLTVLFLSLLDNSIIEQFAAEPLAAISNVTARVISGRF